MAGIIRISLRTYSGVIRELCKLLTVDVKPKVKRLVIAILRNYSEVGSNYVAQLLRFQLNESLEATINDHMDEEELEDVSYLKEKMSIAIQKMSNFDEYYAELQSGELEWTPYHKSTLFWKNNSSRFEEKEYECLRLLLQIYRSSKSQKTLLIFLNDIQQYLCCIPNSSKVLLDLGLKPTLIGLLEYPNEEIKYQALITLQKFLCTDIQQ
jgi:V-type H+-transporting ATPase subunit H